MSRATKVVQAQELLKELGMPRQQQGNRSAWVLLALACIRPQDRWLKAQAPLLKTVDIMQFIREHYGQDYKPNSRETIRRQTLHQFEQAGLVERNRDDPSRATNSGNNNYSLNAPVLAILHEYPSGNWQQKLKECRQKLLHLKNLYQRKLEKEKIPVKLPDGKKIRLSPGKHNQLHADIIHEFCPRFIGKSGVVLYIGDTASSRGEGGKYMVWDTERLSYLGIPAIPHDKLPDIVVHDEKRDWLFLIEAVVSHGPVSPKRHLELEKIMKDCKIGRVYVTAFADYAAFRRHAADIAWETEVWIAKRPDHMIHFDGNRFLGPYGG